MNTLTNQANAAQISSSCAAEQVQDETPTPLLDAASCYRAVTARDARFDGVFFTAVHTTGIYCRPVCSAKTPAATSCSFYGSAAAAEQAGFRPCLRCRPELAPYALQENLAYAVWQKICAGALNDGNLENLAQQVGLSSRQLRRVLQQHFGVSPIELAQTQRLLLAKQLLTETHLPMTEIAFAAGFGSVRRFNATFSARYQLAPGNLRKTAAATTLPENSHWISLRLAFRPPFDWPALLGYLASRRMQGIEIISANEYCRSVRIGNCEGFLRLTAAPRSGDNFLILHLSTSLLPVLQAVLSRVRELADLDANPSVIHQNLTQDPLMAKIFPLGLRVPGAFEPYELAIRAILGQQVSLAAGNTLCARLIQKFGTAIKDSPWPEIHAHFPRPEVLAETSVDALAQLGLPQSRAQTIQTFARFAHEGGLQTHIGQGLQQTLQAMQTLPGIGEWSANYIALRALRFPDAFPAGDLVLQKALARLLEPASERLTSKQLSTHAAQWTPWRGYAALALWRSMSNLEEKK